MDIIENQFPNTSDISERRSKEDCDNRHFINYGHWYCKIYDFVHGKIYNII